MAAPGKQYGLILPKKLLQRPAFLPKHSAFADDSDEETTVGSRLQKEALKKKVMKQTKLEMQKALEQDATVYEYDSVYDDMQKKKEENSTAQMLAVKEKKPKYIQSLLQAVEVRKKEQEKRMEKKIQKEREAEGAEFEDKEAFVTSAYKKKLEERTLEEEQEKREAAIEASMDVTKQKDLSGFYRHLLNQTVGEEQAPECSLRDGRVKDEKPKGYSDEVNSANPSTGEENGPEDTMKKENTPDPEVNMGNANKQAEEEIEELPESQALPKKEGGRESSVSSEDDTKGHHIQRQSRSSSEEKASLRADKHSPRESKKSHKKEKGESGSSSKKEKQHKDRDQDRKECSNQPEKERHRDKGERHRHSDHGSKGESRKRDEAEGRSRKKEKNRKRDKEREDKHSERERQRNGKDKDKGEKHRERDEQTKEEKRERSEKERKKHSEHEESPQSTSKAKETAREGETVPVHDTDMMESKEIDQLGENEKDGNVTQESSSNPEEQSELKRKDEEAEGTGHGEEMVESKSKFAKRSNEETVLSARDRYLARQMARVSTKSYIEKEED